MRIRLDGTRAEITDALLRLRELFTVATVSRAYPNRSQPRHWLVYVDTAPRERR
ncbi:DUF3970 family protein [Planomonospora corallina]|uniref:DUF3970 family protein n=1 Tax=Planomonospora corallina TaxID=1806052 RepID=A0ABV8IH05_9ACTN